MKCMKEILGNFLLTLVRVREGSSYWESSVVRKSTAGFTKSLS